MSNKRSLSLASVLAAAWLAVPATAQTTWYVDNDNCPGPGTGTQEDPFCTIQRGINAADAGDEVRVAVGTYRGSGNKNLDFGGKAIALRSALGWWFTDIDCEGSGRAFHFQGGETNTAVVDGFRIRHAYSDFGGAIMCSGGASPTIVDCWISDNEASDGGGAIACYQSNPVIANCTITQNSAGENGGGIFLSQASPTIVNCSITENVVTGDLTGYGGGVHCDNGSNPTITNCLMTGNAAYTSAGAIGCYASHPTVVNCTITGNTVTQGYPGGALLCFDNSNPTITSSILWGNVPDEINVASGTPVVTYSDIEGGWTGTGNKNVNPMFLDFGHDDYHLWPGSPCIDAGDNTAVPADVADLDDDANTTERTPLDLDGYARFVNDRTTDTGVTAPGYPNIVDMGAYEFDGDEAQACCDGNDECTSRTANACVDLGYTPEGPGTVCSSLRVCYLPDDCPWLDPLCCIDIGGRPSGYGGPGVVSSGRAESCACCLEGGAVCVDTTVSCCEGTGGTVGSTDHCSGDANGNGVDDACEPPIPTVSEWGVVAMTLLVLTAATLVLMRRRVVVTSAPPSPD